MFLCIYAKNWTPTNKPSKIILKVLGTEIVMLFLFISKLCPKESTKQKTWEIHLLLLLHDKTDDANELLCSKTFNHSTRARNFPISDVLSKDKVNMATVRVCRIIGNTHDTKFAGTLCVWEECFCFWL